MSVFIGDAQPYTIKQNTIMIHHSVIFTFKSSIDSSTMQAFFMAAKKLSAIPGVENFETLRQVSKKNKYAYGLSMQFANEELYQQYNNHPVHVQFIKEHWLLCIDDFLEIDYKSMEEFL